MMETTTLLERMCSCRNVHLRTVYRLSVSPVCLPSVSDATDSEPRRQIPSGDSNINRRASAEVEFSAVASVALFFLTATTSLLVSNSCICFFSFSSASLHINTNTDFKFNIR